MAISTDAMYNAESRYLHKMYRIHFSDTKILDVVTSNYLISSSILEETSKISEKPFGDITSNELELSLLNADGMFSPKNTKGPYYSLIRNGVEIEAFIRPDGVDEWDPIGVFYVTDWNTSSNGMTADVIANDRLHSVLNAPVPSMGVIRNVKLSDFLTEYFALFGADITVDASVDTTLPYVFTSGYSSNRNLLADLMVAAIADCYCLHNGNIVVRRRTAPRDLRATFTDSDQLISVAIKQSISTDYDSASVTCNAMQESAEQEVLSISSLPVGLGVTSTDLTKFITSNVVSVRSIRVDSYSAKPIAFNATADNIVISLQSTSREEVTVKVLGTVLNKVSSVVSTEGTSAVSLNSNFVQTLDNANQLLTYSDRYVNEAASTVELTIRGNPKIELGSKIRINSTKYKLDYTGTLVKAQYKYDGGLSCTATLMIDMTEEVQDGLLN